MVDDTQINATPQGSEKRKCFPQNINLLLKHGKQTMISDKEVGEKKKDIDWIKHAVV